MIITLKDGSKKEYDHAMSVIDIASDISEGLTSLPWPWKLPALWKIT